MKIHCYEIFLQTRFTYVYLKLNMNKNSMHSYVCTEMCSYKCNELFLEIASQLLLLFHSFPNNETFLNRDSFISEHDH